MSDHSAKLAKSAPVPSASTDPLGPRSSRVEKRSTCARRSEHSKLDVGHAIPSAELIDIEKDQPRVNQYASFYRPLDAKSGWIRLIDVHSGIGDRHVSCSIRTTLLSTCPRYFALSYVWGDQHDTESITVQGETVHATKNLVAALKRVRSADMSKLVWVDAICINQQNNEERSGQVGLMAQIYQQAAQVLIYLGTEADAREASQRAMDERLTISSNDHDWQQIANSNVMTQIIPHYNEHHRAYCPDNSPDMSKMPSGEGPFIDALHIITLLAQGKHLHELPFYQIRDRAGSICAVWNQAWSDAIDALASIMSLPWWKRVWVIQEALLPAQSPLVLFGKAEILFERFRVAHISLDLHRSNCCKRLGAVLTLQRPGKPALLDALVPFNTVNSVFTMTTNRDYFTTILSQGSRQRCGEEKDHIYGLLGLFMKFGIDLKPDYLRPGYDLWLQFSVQALERTRSLDVFTDTLCVTRKEVQNARSARGSLLPSWCLDFSKSLGLVPGRASEEYMCLHSVPWVRYRDCIRIDKDKLSIHVAAAYLGDIGHISSAAPMRAPDDITACCRDTELILVWRWISRCVDWMETLGRDKRDMNFWSLLSAVCVSSQAGKEDAEGLRQAYESGSIAIEERDGKESLSVPPLNGVPLMIWRWLGFETRLFVTSTGYMGLTWSDDIRVGDSLYVLRTMARPVVLRHAPDHMAEESFTWVSATHVAGLEHVGCLKFKEKYSKDIVLV